MATGDAPETPSVPPAGEQPVPPAVTGDQPPALETDDDKQMAMFCHASALLGAVICLPFLGPLILWLVRREASPIVAYHAKEALNFQIIVSAAAIILVPLGFLHQFLLVFSVAAVAFGGVMAVIVGMKANEGIAMPYPAVIFKAIK